MAATIFYERDADIHRLRAKKVAVIGYGSQGRAHALNLSDSGIDVRVGAREGSETWARAVRADFAVGSVAEVSAWADVVMLLAPDTAQPRLFREQVLPHLSEGKTLMFAHGFNVEHGTIVPPPGVDVSLVAPKGPGHHVRDTYLAGSGVPALLAVHADATGGARADALAYAKAIGATRAWVLLTTFQGETEYRFSLREWAA